MMAEITHTVHPQLFVDTQGLNGERQLWAKFFYSAVYCFMQNMVLVKLLWTRSDFTVLLHKHIKQCVIYLWRSLQEASLRVAVSSGSVQVVRSIGGVICLLALPCSCCLHTLLTRSSNMTEYGCGAFICSAPAAWIL